MMTAVRPKGVYLSVSPNCKVLVLGQKASANMRSVNKLTLNRRKTLYGNVKYIHISYLLLKEIFKPSQC